MTSISENIQGWENRHVHLSAQRKSIGEKAFVIESALTEGKTTRRKYGRTQYNREAQLPYNSKFILYPSQEIPTIPTLLLLLCSLC